MQWLLLHWLLRVPIPTLWLKKVKYIWNIVALRGQIFNQALNSQSWEPLSPQLKGHWAFGHLLGSLESIHYRKAILERKRRIYRLVFQSLYPKSQRYKRIYFCSVAHTALPTFPADSLLFPRVRIPFTRYIFLLIQMNLISNYRKL